MRAVATLSNAERPQVVYKQAKLLLIKSVVEQVKVGAKASVRVPKGKHTAVITRIGFLGRQSGVSSNAYHDALK